MKRVFSVLMLALLFFSLSFTTVASGYTNVTVSEAKTMIDSNPSLVVLDVRTQSEYDLGHIRNAKLIPVTELEGRLNELNKTDEILVYCKSGGRSATASQILADNGFLHVYNMLGGITAWIAAGYPVYVKYASIQEAINNSNEGDTIYVSSGTYYEHVVVNKTVSLVGENRETTIIDGNSIDNVLEITDDNVNVADFSIQNSGSTWLNNFGVNLASRRNCTIENCIIKNHGYSVYLAYGSCNNTIRNNIITNSSSYAIMIYSSCQNNTIINNLIINNECVGVEVEEFSEGNIIAGNNISSNDYDGVYIIHSNSNLVINNILSFNGHKNPPLIYPGITLMYSSNNTLVNNTIFNNTGGILVRFDWCSEPACYNQIQNNSIENNDYGIILHYTGNQSNPSTNTYNRVHRNTLKNNGYGIYLRGVDNNILYHNNFLDNIHRQVIVENSTNIWDNGCEGNYWSNYNGSDNDSDGIGDTYLPWEGIDYYPLMNPYWNPADINYDLKVDMRDIGLAANAFGSYPTHPSWNPHADITGQQYLVPDKKVNMRDIGLIGKNFGKTYA